MAGKGGTAGRCGRKKKPHGMKLLEGTAKPGDEPEVEFPEADSSDPPYWVTDKHALIEWDHLFPILSESRVMTEGDRSELGQLVNLHAKIVKKWLADDCPSGTILARIQSFYCDFGLNPASRGRVKPVSAKKSDNRFAEFG